MPSLKRAVLGLVAAGALLSPLSAEAAVARQPETLWNLFGLIGHDAPDPVLAHAAPVVVTPRVAALPDPATVLPATPPRLAVAAPPAPWVERLRHRLSCVPYARAVSGLNLSGDAKYWWARARNLYARLTTPVEDAVMVFSGSHRLRHGHVAVVTAIVSPREIRVDQANWQNHGEIDHATPVLDVSPDNDWSRVRVWDIATHSFGTHVYAISGFIAKALDRQAMND